MKNEAEKSKKKQDTKTNSINKKVNHITKNKNDIRDKSNNSKKDKKKKSTKFKVLSWVFTIVALIIIVYCGAGYVVYADAFMPGTTINGEDVSNLSTLQCVDKFSKMANEYSIAIKKDGDAVESIKLSDIDASVSKELSKDIRDLAQSQHKLLWGLGYITKAKDYELKNIIKINDSGYDKFIKDSVGYNLPTTIESADQSIIFENGKFNISDPIYGDEIDKELYAKKLKQAMMNMDSEFDIKDADCYTKPKEHKDKSKYEQACKKANEMIDYGSLKLKINGEDSGLENEIIEASLVIDKDFNVKLDKDTINDAVKKVSDKYNTMGGTRKFNTSHGTVVEVKGGDYGRSLNLDGVSDMVYSSLLNGASNEKSLPYKQNLFKSDADTIGNTYIEIDLTNQYVWVYSDGKLVAESPCVTGLAGGSRETPQGVYSLKNKVMDVPLVGTNYVTPVKYWMPFNGGIGLHDAVWQSKFGGELYKTKGSHGCVNLPMDKAELIYKNAVVNMPVVAYYTDRNAEKFKAVPSTGMIAGQYRGLTAAERIMLANIKAGRPAGSGAIMDSVIDKNKVVSPSAVE